MRITAVYDKSGAILAAVEIDDHYSGPVPVASATDHSVRTFDVPERMRKLQFDEICSGLRVTTEKDQHVLAEKEGHSHR